MSGFESDVGFAALDFSSVPVWVIFRVFTCTQRNLDKNLPSMFANVCIKSLTETN